MIYNIAIDGPAGAGKSTIARRVAKELSFIYVDTGAMYRAMALYLLRKEVNKDDTEQIGNICQDAEISIEYQNGEQIVLLNDENVNSYLRTEEVGNMASVSSAVPRVREKLLSLQRKLARDMSVVMDGRDIGTVVLPGAQVKIFLTASAGDRARRRYDELIARGEWVSYEQVLADVERRDYNDTHRAAAPLRPAADAVTVDTTGFTFDDAFALLLSTIRARLGQEG